MKNLLNKYSFLKPLKESQVDENSKRAIPDIIDGLTCNKIDEKINELLKNSSISYSNQFLKIKNNNTLIGVTDEFIVALKDTSQIAELQFLALQTNSIIKRQK